MRIVVDLTPLLPGGANGGAKPMVLALLRHLPELTPPDWTFIFLTAEHSHEELAVFDRDNVSRVCVIKKPAVSSKSPKEKFLWKTWVHRILVRFLPQKMVGYIKLLYYRFNLRKDAPVGLLAGLKADLLFNPFTAPTYYDPKVPSVSIVYDLQFMAYPQFFLPDDLFYRQQHFENTVRLSSHIVTISDFVRQTVLENTSLSPQQVTSLPIGLVRPLLVPSEEHTQEILSALGLTKKRFLLYPANFWLHKNHEMLLVAFQRFLKRNPSTDLKLVCTGALEERRNELTFFASRMKLDDSVLFPGFLSEEDLGALYQTAQALIFPSLYEGFGIPILEAMSVGIPVLCSQVASLPEVAGDAAIYFNPGSPQQIADAIQKIEEDTEYRELLIEQGIDRLKNFSEARDLAKNYYRILLATLDGEQEYHDYALEGVSADGWILQGGIYLLFPSSKEQHKREWTMTLSLPNWFPTSAKIQVHNKTSKLVTAMDIAPGETKKLSYSLPRSSGYLTLSSSPLFSPFYLGTGNDTRSLGLYCANSQITCNDTLVTLRDDTDASS